MDFDPYTSFTASRSAAPSSPGERARDAALWLKQQRELLDEDVRAHHDNKQRAIEQDRANREKLKLDSRESLDADLIPILGRYFSDSVVIIAFNCCCCHFLISQLSCLFNCRQYA